MQKNTLVHAPTSSSITGKTGQTKGAIRRSPITSSPQPVSAQGIQISSSRSFSIRNYVGALIGLGFIAISCASNFLFASSLTATAHLAYVYGGVGVLATLVNAWLPLRLLDAWHARLVSVFLAGAVLFACTLGFSLVSALGFAATIRDTSFSDQAALSANYATVVKIAQELEALPKRTKQQQEALTKTRRELIAYREKGSMKVSDAQTEALAFFGIKDARWWVSFLFAVLVELGACFGLLIAFADTTRRSIPISKA